MREDMIYMKLFFYYISNLYQTNIKEPEKSDGKNKTRNPNHLNLILHVMFTEGDLVRDLSTPLCLNFINENR